MANTSYPAVPVGPQSWAPRWQDPPHPPAPRAPWSARTSFQPGHTPCPAQWEAWTSFLPPAELFSDIGQPGPRVFS